MAINITARVTGQSVSSDRSYKYTSEPLFLNIFESGASTMTISVRVNSILTPTQTLFTFNNYFFAQLSAGSINIDLMAILKSLMEGEMFRVGAISDIDYTTILGLYHFEFDFRTNITSTPTMLSIIPLIGGRTFKSFSSVLNESSPLTEWQQEGITQPLFKNYPNIVITLRSPTGATLTPIITPTTPSTGRSVCGGYLVWKSRLGGWMSYGFDIMQEEESSNYGNSISQELYEVKDNGNIFVPTDYMEVVTSRNITLRSIGVPKSEAKALRSLQATPLAYIYENGRLELMRITGVSIPISNLVNGVDVSVNLSSISTTKQNVR